MTTKLTLEDLTKAELIKLVRESFFYQPTQRDLIKLRWESMTEEANRIMKEANQEREGELILCLGKIRNAKSE